MANRDTNITTPIKGLNLDNHSSVLNAKEAYTFALNARQESEDGNRFYLSNEASTTLSLKFSEGYIVLGTKNIEDNQTIIFLYNPITKLSEIGTIINDTSKCIDNLDETIEINCEECKKNYKYPPNIGESIELSTTPCQEYTTIISSECLNFNPNHPIHRIDYRITNSTIELYWTDNYNPMRWLDLGNIPKDDIGNLDCNAIKIFPDFSVPCIHVEEELHTGSLKSGVYQFFVAYANDKGEELSQYYSPTNPASISDNIITEDLGFTTSKSININIGNLDTRYKHINIAVAETVQSTTTFKLIGIFDIETEDFNYTYTGNDKTLRELTSADIFFQTPIYIQAETLAVQNNILMFGGLLAEKEINCQSVANLIELGWGDMILPYNKFESYNTAENTANYRSYLRDEVYAFEFVPIFKSGKLGKRFHIPGPKAQPSYFEIIGNKDATSFKTNPCEATDTIYRWQLYNTATFEGFDEIFDNSTIDNCYIGPYQYGTLGYYQSTRSYPNNKDVWGDLAGSPIRHHKMPGVDKSPIFSTSTNQDGSINYSIHPLGIKPDEKNIQNAINNSTLTQEQKDNIIGFQIVRATRTGNNSIIAKGLFYNVGQYTRDSQQYYYPNYPYNDLNPDPFISQSQPVDHSGSNDGEPVIRVGDIEYKQSDYPTQVVAYGQLPECNSFSIPVNINGYSQLIELSGCVGEIPANTISTNPTYWDIQGAPLDSNYNSVGFSTININTTSISDPVFISLNLSGYMSNGDIYSTYLTLMFQQDNNGKLIPTTLHPSNFTGYDYRIRLDGQEYTISGVTAPDIYNSAIYKGRGNIIISSYPDIRLRGFTKGISDNRYSFIAPNTGFVRPPLNGFMKVECIMSGKSEGYLHQVKDEPKYSINTNLTVKVAVSLAAATVINLNYGAGTFGWPTILINFDSFTSTFIQTLDMMNKLVPFRRYGYQYSSIGKYDNTPIYPSEGNMIRSLDLAGYIDPGMQSINDNKIINNFNRESSVYIKTSEPLPFPHEYGAPIDNSRFNFNSYLHETGVELKDNERVTRNISSIYGSIKRRFDDQYGEMYSYRTISTGQCYYLDQDFPLLFGGDTFINNYAIKRKVPFFLTNTVGLANNTDIAYNELGNVGYPTYFLSTFPVEAKLSDETIRQADVVFDKVTDWSFGNILKNLLTSGITALAPLIKFTTLIGTDILKKLGVKNTNFDRYKEDGISEIGTFYLFSYGIPNFFVESDVNIQLRQAGNATDKNFYPNVGTDIPQEWLEEVNVSITKDNYYLYNRDFSKQNLENFYTNLDRDYNPLKPSNVFTSRVIYSETSSFEDKQNNWLVYKANNYYDFPLTNGRLVDLNALEQGKVLARFEDNISVYNAFVQIDTDNKTAIVGTGSMFSTPPQEYSNASLGYLGTQHKAFISCKYGYFWVDAKRGEVLQLGTGGGGIKEISKKGMSNWLKENLPFKLKKEFSTINIDNSFNSIGISIVWDNRYERLFITKKDYIPNNNCIAYNEEGKFFYNKYTTIVTNTCPLGYIYNPITDMCEKEI